MVSQTNYGSRAMKDRVYTPRPLPTDTENFNAYFADEFSYLGGFIDKMLSGQSIPYRSELPARVKDGMVIYFKNEIKDLQSQDSRKYIIPTPGLYVFKGVIDESKPVGGASEPLLKGGEWLRLIEDPESLNRNLTAYASVLETLTPIKPREDSHKPEDILPWKYSLPEERAGYMIYRVDAINAFVGNPPKVHWEDPIPNKTAGDDGASVEFRYVASTERPVVANSNERFPKTTSGRDFTSTVPSASPPDRTVIWVIQSYVRGNKLMDPWSSPSKFATPDILVEVSAYQASDGDYTGFDSTASGLPGVSWSKEIPLLPARKSLWRSTRTEWYDGGKHSDWNTPIKMTGADGAPGAGFYTIYSTTLTSWPSNATQLFTTEVGRAPLKDDVLTISNSASNFYETRRYNGSSWIKPEALFDGDVIAKGTIVGDRLVAGTEILAPVIKSAVIQSGYIEGVAIKSGSITGDTELKIGAGGPFAGYNFHVTPQGDLFANNGTFNGTVNIEKSTGVISGIGGVYISLREPPADTEEGDIDYVGNIIPSSYFPRLFTFYIEDHSIMDGSRMYNANTYGDAYSTEITLYARDFGRIGDVDHAAHKFGINADFPRDFIPTRGVDWLPTTIGSYPTNCGSYATTNNLALNMLVPANKEVTLYARRRFWMRRKHVDNTYVTIGDISIRYVWHKHTT